MAFYSGNTTNEEDFLSGVTIDFLFEYMDDDEFKLQCDDALVEDPQQKTQSLCCSHCGKSYKSKGGLKKHQDLKHTEITGTETEGDTISLDSVTIKSFIEEAKEDISKDECFPDEIRSIAVAYVTEDVNNSLKEEILKIYQSLKRNGDAEKFYSAFYSLIVKNAKKYFSQLEMPVCTILASQLADKILAFYKKPVQQPVVVKPISEREFDGLQYLAGYVIHSLVRKYNRKTDSKSEAVQGVLLLLNSCRSDDISTQRLIQCQSRGGLWGVKREVIELFKLVEEEFRRETQSHVVSINCQEITQKLMKHIDITSLFNTIKEYDAHTLEKETSLSLLENMIKLYLRVRAFSITKTKTQLERKRVKGLRKGIKKSSDKDITGV
ncbi:uncharacterized protein LOC135688367 [Rhopilema esculentum]|uniref:uncharacterized protein LOC135688367 n=1 Tax=Rhopilema esculentum TaxID=499914 RepID=UPI0031E339CB